MPGSAAGWVARRLPLADDHHRDELAGSVAAVVAERPPCERAWETASLVGLWLWARREGGDDVRLAVRQGVYLGGILLAFAASAWTWSQARGATGAVSAVAAAVLASGTAALATRGWRASAVVASIGSVVAATVSSGAPPTVGIVAAVALLAGDRFGARRCWGGLAAGMLASGLVAAVATQAPTETMSVAEILLS